MHKLLMTFYIICEKIQSVLIEIMRKLVLLMSQSMFVLNTTVFYDRQ